MDFEPLDAAKPEVCSVGGFGIYPDYVPMLQMRKQAEGGALTC